MIQYQLSNGNWADADDERAERLIASATRFIENHPNRSALLGQYATVTERLNAGKSVSCGTDWYDVIRIKPDATFRPAVEVIKCSCGHSVPRGSVMSTSLGTSCPDCYDRMSE